MFVQNPSLIFTSRASPVSLHHHWKIFRFSFHPKPHNWFSQETKTGEQTTSDTHPKKQRQPLSLSKNHGPEIPFPGWTTVKPPPPEQPSPPKKKKKKPVSIQISSLSSKPTTRQHQPSLTNHQTTLCPKHQPSSSSNSTILWPTTFHRDYHLSPQIRARFWG